MKETLITRINDVAIAATSNEQGEVLIPIRPICDALGVNSNGQIEKIKSDPILGATDKLSLSVGPDGRQREMVCLPLQYVFGWLFTINPGNVDERAKEAVIRYKKECYDALYNHFARARQRQLDENREEIRLLAELTRVTDEIQEAKGKRRSIETKLAKLRAARLDEQPSLFD